MVAVAREVFNIPEGKETRLWNKYTSNTFELLDNYDSTLQVVRCTGTYGTTVLPSFFHSDQCCGSEIIFFGSGSDFSGNFGSGSDFGFDLIYQ